jgi:hypothetical protein
MKCGYCGIEIDTIKTHKDGVMVNMHVNKHGSIEKCYTVNKGIKRLLFGKKNYKHKSRYRCKIEQS